jgi:excisionase family DNA binding protein
MSTPSSPGAGQITEQKESLLTIAEAATYLNVPVRWVADAVRQRKVRCTRIGKHVRFRPEHLEELIEAGEQPVTMPTQPLAVVPQPRGRSSRSRL